MLIAAFCLILSFFSQSANALTVDLHLTLNKRQYYRQIDKKTLKKISSTVTGIKELTLSEGSSILTKVKKELNYGQEIAERDEIRTLDKNTIEIVGEFDEDPNNEVKPTTARVRRTIFRNLKEITISAIEMKLIFAEILLEKTKIAVDELNLDRRQIDYEKAEIVTYLSDLICKKVEIKLLECKYTAAIDFKANTL